MSNNVDVAIAEVAGRCGGHVTRAQLADLGISRGRLSTRVSAGLIVPVGGQTFRLRSTLRSNRGDVMAACLEYGGVASHRTAAWLHGIGERPRSIDVLVKKGRTLRSRSAAVLEAPSVVLHATTSLPYADVIQLGPLPVTSVARTALGLAALVPAELSQKRLEDIVGRSVDLELASDPWLWWLLTQRRCRGRNGVLALEEVMVKQSQLGPTESYLERRVLAVLGDAGLPLPTTQKVIRRRGRFAARVDFCYERQRVVLEALGYAHHRTVAEMEADTRRINELILAGYDAYQFTFRQATGDPESLVRTVQTALRNADLAQGSPGQRRWVA